MSLVELAKKKAEAEKKAEKEKADRKAEERNHLETHLKKLTSKVMKGLKEFDKVQTKEGILVVTKSKVGMHYAAIRLLHKSYEEDLLFVDAKITSGYTDYSDDCRNIPYTDAAVTIERPFMNPEKNWDRQDVRGNFHTYITKLEKVDEELEKVAEFLSKLF